MIITSILFKVQKPLKENWIWYIFLVQLNYLLGVVRKGRPQRGGGGLAQMRTRGWG